ncbi:secreted protein [Rhodopirellula maiorica SM1]|uniref:Secreted protein n=1 Tax=Rhodopirellula maiorica SM1 TaxID=1265738 RepID=M5RGQ1_9BACT|nr:secreted protein [Rhodopirellula maiorica SM1]
MQITFAKFIAAKNTDLTTTTVSAVVFLLALGIPGLIQAALRVVAAWGSLFVESPLLCIATGLRNRRLLI